MKFPAQCPPGDFINEIQRSFMHIEVHKAEYAFLASENDRTGIGERG
jgi:hypothetical protein